MNIPKNHDIDNNACPLNWHPDDRPPDHVRCLCRATLTLAAVTSPNPKDALYVYANQLHTLVKILQRPVVSRGDIEECVGRVLTILHKPAKVMPPHGEGCNCVFCERDKLRIERDELRTENTALLLKVSDIPADSHDRADMQALNAEKDAYDKERGELRELLKHYDHCNTLGCFPPDKPCECCKQRTKFGL